MMDNKEYTNQLQAKTETLAGISECKNCVYNQECVNVDVIRNGDCLVYKNVVYKKRMH